MPDAGRWRLHRMVLLLAAGYNLAFGAWAVLRPADIFDLFGLAASNQPAIWRCLGMVIGVYGAGYAWAAFRPDLVKPIVTLGLVGKILGPIGWIATVASGEWPVRTFTLILFNDVVWWLPFGLILLDGTRLGARMRAAAPFVCAALNALGAVVMLLVLRHGLESEPDATARAAFVTGHLGIWRASWGIWIAAALSLAAFYGWWGTRLPDPRPGRWAFAITLVGLAADLTAETLYIGWAPLDEATMRVAGLLTGGVGNGLYTVAGIVLTLATPMGGLLRGITWAVWASGAALTAGAIAGSVTAMSISTAALLTLFCPWCAWLGWKLR
ncbi:MAG TPA: hypothetical protein VK661_10020 [Planctomycetota bacterium]|nr:hypothetical protein [Planctomycetota bacterium]